MTVCHFGLLSFSVIFFMLLVINTIITTFVFITIKRLWLYCTCSTGSMAPGWTTHHVRVFQSYSEKQMHTMYYTKCYLQAFVYNLYCDYNNRIVVGQLHTLLLCTTKCLFFWSLGTQKQFITPHKIL